jgi:septum formation protein
MQIVLASKSPARAALLGQIGLKFKIMPSGIDERSVPRSNPVSYVKKLASMKAYAVAHKLAGRGRERQIVIGADTIVYNHGRIIGKPENRDDAVRTLQSLSNSTHEIITGLCIMDSSSTPKEFVCKAVRTRVRFRNITAALLDWYIKTGEWRNHAGSYTVQGRGYALVLKLEGDYSNAVGLPIPDLINALKEFDVELPRQKR